jgi:tRNA nucleotidyltransferase/poly(A) polymerase
MRKFKEYLVGGAVRDEILGLSNKDLDYVFVFEDLYENQTAEECFNEMYQNIQDRGEIFLSTPSCYTIRYKDRETKEVKDVVMARKEIGYIEGTRTPIIKPGSLYDDLERRDFTLNALAKDENGKIIDYFNGIEDLKRGYLRTPLETTVTFNDDPLRILRAIRFCITKGFWIGPAMDGIIQDFDYETKMGVVSTERIREELYKCFKFDTIQTLRDLNDYPMLRNYIFRDNNLWLTPTLELK